MNQLPLLSICIPTYNRVNLLSESLDILLTQINENNKNDIEIIISDNASTDGTAELVTEKSRIFKHAYIKYIRQVENIGSDRNFLFVISKATGKYFLVLSDDDFLLPGGVNGLLIRLKKHTNLDAMAINVSWYKNRYDENVQPIYTLDSDRIIYDRDSAFKFLSTNITFISCLVVRHDLVDKKIFLDPSEPFFPQSRLFLTALANEKGLLITKDIIIAARGNIAVGYDVFEVFVTSFGKLMNYAQSIGYCKDVTQNVLKQHSRWLAGYTEGLVLSKSVKCKSFHRLDASKRVFAVFGFNVYVFVKIIMILLLPRPVAFALNTTCGKIRQTFEMFGWKRQ